MALGGSKGAIGSQRYVEVGRRENINDEVNRDAFPGRFPTDYTILKTQAGVVAFIMSPAQDDKEVDIGQLTMVPYTDASPYRPRQASTHHRMSSISYPDISDAKVVEKQMSPRTVSRSKTLPRHSPVQFPTPTRLDKLPMDLAKLPKMRRWILGLVLGK
jgi:hypothetical protein